MTDTATRPGAARPAGPLLDRRSLNRATLERQLLLRRWQLPVPAVVERLVGLQAQTPHSWYVGLWSRLVDLRPEPVGELLAGRQLVRIALLRATIHLVTPADCGRLRPLLATVLHRTMSGAFGRQLSGVDPAELAAAGRALLEERPRTFSQLGALLAERWPGRDPLALSQAVRAWVPLVQVPPRGVWGRSGPIAHTTAEAWLGRPLATDPPAADLVLRYLAAFGPASVRDVQAWSGLTRLREVVEPLRPRLRTFRDENGVELFDLPDAPRPAPDTPAPPRFLYDYDNLLLSHADRGRFVTDSFRQRFPLDGPVPGVLLVDGTTAGLWALASQGAAATLTIRPVRRLSGADREAVTAEAAGLLGFAAAGAGSPDIQFVRPQ